MDHFNPTNISPPFFQVYHPGFLKVIGSDPSIRAIAVNPSFAFAHEAPIWVPETDELFFSSQNGGPLGFSDWDTNNQVGKLSLSEAKRLAVASGSKTSPLNATVTPVSPCCHLGLGNPRLTIPIDTTPRYSTDDERRNGHLSRLAHADQLWPRSARTEHRARQPTSAVQYLRHPRQLLRTAVQLAQ